MSIEGPIYFHLVSYASNQQRLMVKLPVSPDFWHWEQNDPATKQLIMGQLQKARDDEFQNAGIVPLKDKDEYWVGDDTPDAFVRNREMKRLDW